MKKTTLIIEETFEQLVLRRPAARMRFRCLQCLTDANWLNTPDAVLLSGLSERRIHRLLDEGHLHYCETSVGAVLICEVSLRDFLTEH